MKKISILLILFLVFEKAKGQSLFTQIHTGTTQQLLDIFSPNSNTVYVTGDHGIFKKSVDGGITWSQNISTGTNQALWSVTSIKDDTLGLELYIVGDIPDIIRSRDGGGTFSSLNTGLPSGSFLTGIYCLDSQHIYACGATPNGGCFIKSSDGGNTWQINSVHQSVFLFKLLFVDTLNGYMVGSGNNTSSYAIYKTTDGGINWVNSHSTNNSITNISCINKDTCIAVGVHGQILYTKNSGQNWVHTNNSIDTTDILGIRSYENGDCYAVGGKTGDSSFLYYSNDFGLTWKADYMGYIGSITALSVNTFGRLNLYCSAQGGIVLKLVGVNSINPIKYNRKNAVNIYPNPADAIVQIVLPDNHTGGVLTVTNILGNILYYQEEIPGKSKVSVDVSTCPQGLHQAIFIEKSGNIATGEFIIK